MSFEACRTADDFHALIERSRTQPVVILKHSTRCPISAAAHREMEKFTATHSEVPCAVVLVVEDRPLSLLVAEETGVAHQSPQALVLSGGAVLWSASHYSITSQHVVEACGLD
jgi:bacillithiol system protein YtxJ